MGFFLKFLKCLFTSTIQPSPLYDLQEAEAIIVHNYGLDRQGKPSKQTREIAMIARYTFLLHPRPLFLQGDLCVFFSNTKLAINIENDGPGRMDTHKYHMSIIKRLGGPRSVKLITDPYHMLRAKMDLEKMGCTVYCVDCHKAKIDPNAKILIYRYNWLWHIYETLCRLYYLLSGKF